MTSCALPTVYPVEFNYSIWIQTFPEFSGVSELQADGYFAMATIVQRNDSTSPISSPANALMLLNYLTAHFCVLFTQSYGDPYPGGPKPATGVVGRVSSATEGTVTIQTDYGANVSQNAAWFLQTKYGATWWALTAQYRTMRYMPGRLQTGGLFASTQI